MLQSYKEFVLWKELQKHAGLPMGYLSTRHSLEVTHISNMAIINKNSILDPVLRMIADIMCTDLTNYYPLNNFLEEVHEGMYSGRELRASDKTISVEGMTLLVMNDKLREACEENLIGLSVDVKKDCVSDFESVITISNKFSIGVY